MKALTSTDLSGKINDIYKKGQNRGVSTGFKNIDELYRIKLGCTTYITGIPSHGKSQFLFEILMNTAVNNGMKHALFTPETGTPVDIWIKLIETYTKKRFSEHGNIGLERMTQRELSQATNYLSQFFILIDPEEDQLTPGNFLKFAESLKREHGIHTLTLDPWNELDHDFNSKGGREDKYLEFTLGEVRRAARAQKIHIFLIAHPRTMQQNAGGNYDAPTAFQISGGAAWYAKAESIICIHRPDIFSNLTQVHVQKAKPAIIGKQGRAELFFSMKTGRYTEQDESSGSFNQSDRLVLPEAEMF